MARTPKRFAQVTLGSSADRAVTGATFLTEDNLTYTVNVSTNKPFKADTVVVKNAGGSTYARIQDQVVDTYDGAWTTSDNLTYTVHDNYKPLKTNTVTAWVKTAVADKETYTFSCQDPGTYKIWKVDGDPEPKPWTDDTVTVYVADSVQASGYTLDRTTGTITFDTGLTAEADVDATFTWWTAAAPQSIDLDAGTVTFGTATASAYFKFTWLKTMYTVNNTNGTVTFVEEVTDKTFDYTWIETVPTSLFTVAATNRMQATQIFITNPTAATAEFKLYAHGSATANLLMQDLDVAAGGATLLSDMRIILEQTEQLYAMGTGLVVTVYGILEEGVLA